MAFIKLTPAQKFFITVILFGMTVGAITAAYILMYGRVDAVAGDLVRLDTEIASRHSEQQKIGSLAALLRNHSADFDRMRTAGVSRANPVPFLKDFEMLAAETHTTIDINLDSGTATGDTIKFQFAIEGEEKDVAAMLALIEHAPYELTIDTISIQKTWDEQKGGVVPVVSPGGRSSAGMVEAVRSGGARMHLLINVRVKALS